MWVLESPEPEIPPPPAPAPKKVEEDNAEMDPEELKRRNVARLTCNEPPLLGAFKASEKF
jgi:hypothetical protein